MTRRTRHPRAAIASSAVLFVLAACVLPWVGPGPLSLSRVLHRQAPDYQILLDLRLSRTLLALVAGAALSLAGTLFQALLRDALAEPYTLGISAGASLGAVLTIAFGWDTVLGLSATTAGALAGTAVVVLLVLGGGRLGSRGRPLSSFTLLLSGVALNGISSAAILLLSSFAGILRSFSIARWLIGSVDSVPYPQLALLSLVVALSAAFLFRTARSWNLLAVGEPWALTRGVRPTRLLLAGYLAGSLLVAGSIALTGPIGFLGLMVPHLVRTRISADHRVLMPCASLLGGTFLALADALARTVFAPAEIPVGAILALLGGPFLFFVLRARTAAALR